MTMSKTRLTYFLSCAGMALAINWATGCSAPATSDPQGTGGSSSSTAGTTGNGGNSATAGTTGSGLAGGNSGTGTGGNASGGNPGTGGSIATAGTTGSGGNTSGSAGTTGRGGTTGSAGTIGTAGTTGNAGRGGTTGSAGTTGAGGTGGVIAGNPPGWWTSGSMHGCPWTRIDVLNGGPTTPPQDSPPKPASSTTPYCVSGTVGPAPGYNGVALLGFNLSETPTGSANQCAYKAADGTAIGPPAVTVTGTGIAVAFTKT